MVILVKSIAYKVGLGKEVVKSLYTGFVGVHIIDLVLNTYLDINQRFS
jgi:hypothetical protein